LQTGYPVSEPRMPSPLSRRLLALGIGLYLTAHALVLALNVIGDIHRHPVVYFFTWDMFPGTVDVSPRHTAVATTRSGAFLELVPNATMRFRGGVHGGLTRADLDRSGVRLRPLVDHALAWSRSRLAEDPIVRVTLLEQTWPRRLNLSDDLYEAWAGEPKRDVRYWRMIETLDVAPPAARASRPWSAPLKGQVPSGWPELERNEAGMISQVKSSALSPDEVGRMPMPRP
jgi:hypothetical protein